MKLSQKARLVILVLYAVLLFSVCKFVFGTWLPPSAEKGLWLYASLAHLLLGTLLLSPYFTKPADVVSDAVIAALILPEIHGAVLGLNERWASWAWKSIFAYYAVVIVLGVSAMILRGSRAIWGKRIAQSVYVLSTHLGETALVFSLLFFFALFAFHIESMREFITLMATWVVIVPFRLLEHAAMLGKDLQEVWSDSVSYENIGEACARTEPNLVLLRRTAEGALPFGQVLTMKGSAQDTLHHAMIIDEFQLAEERWIRCLEITGQFTPEIEKQLNRTARISPVFKLDAITEQSSIDSAFQVSRVYSGRADMIGLVAPNTDITTLRFELTRTDLEIGEGQLVEVTIGNKQVLYQIINGLTQEEILAQKNTYGFARGSAKKIGAWDKNGKRFEHVRWIPQLNEPVFLQRANVPADDATAIGFFPNTKYPVGVDVQQLVTHNAAILGILGVGKTFLALELVERMLLGEIKVIVLDLTNQYADQLLPYYDANAEQPNIDRLKATGPAGKTNCKLNVAEGGSVQAFQAELKKQLTAFMADVNAGLRIYNPTVFEVWRQDSKPYNNQASMAQLTPTEITRIITEVGLELCSATMSDQAKLCIVYEEAHSLIPEWNAVASEGDKAATNGTAKAILQGRKYGLGCLVITQRTANVTKTILNQCNTVFALRVFDSTGMEFLRNYVGDDYSAVLSTLENRHAVVFGRASSCTDPVLVRLNDRDKFLRLNRPHP
jgi:hypothetical protein